MRAVVVREHGPFATAGVDQLPDPTPGLREVVVAVHAVEANYPDILVMEGRYQVRPPLPFSPGKAAAGVVEAIGADVMRFKVGDRVAVQVEYGAYAEKLLTTADTCYPMPHDMPFEDAAALGLVYQTAHFALVERAAIQAGDTVLVLGASGGIGVASVQLARALGAGKVIAGVLGESNAQIAKQAGADHTVDLNAADLRDSLRKAVFDWTDGHGADIVIDPVGGLPNAAAMRAMAWRGRLVIIGFASGDIPVIKTNYLLVKNISVSGLQWSDYRERDPARVASVQGEIFQLYVHGKVKPYISRRFALADYAQALTLLDTGQAQGKIILQVSQPDCAQ